VITSYGLFSASTNSECAVAQGQLVRHAVRLAIAGVLLAGGSHTARAADAPVDHERAPAVDEIFVTGSVIMRKADDAALPVTVVTTEDLELREGGSTVDLLTSIPAIANVPLNESGTGGSSARGDVSAVALRGMGSGSTLLLLNGRRLAAHGMSSNENNVPVNSVNANILPSRGLSRVDVLRDGASSLYGSDAVAGVVNFVVDTEYEGTELEMSAGFNEIDSGDDRRITLTHGGYSADDRLHWVTTLDWYDRDETSARDVVGDSNKVALAPLGFDSLNGPFFDRSSSSVYPAFRVGSSTTTRYLVPTATGAMISQSTPSRSGEFANDYYYDLNVGYALPESTRLNWFGQLDYEVNDRLTLFGEGLAYHANSTMFRDPITYSPSTDVPIVLAADNPNNPFGSYYYDPAGAANLDGSPRLTGTPQSVRLQSYRFGDNGLEEADVENTAYRVVLGARGFIGSSWNWETAGMWSRAHTLDVSQNGIRESKAHAAIAAGTYNPFGYNFAVVGTEVVPTTLDVNDPAVIAGFREKFIQHGTNVIGSIDARIGGPVYDLWAGSVQLAVGAEYRWDDYEMTRPQFHGVNYENDLGLDPTDNDFVRASGKDDLFGDRTIAAAFAETVIPLASPENAIPLVHSLSIGASMRYERYSDFGSTANPKFTLEYRPIEHVMIRGSYNEGFRAPTLAATHYPPRESGSAYNDPYREPVTGLPDDGSIPRRNISSGNLNLGPETSEGLSLGLVVDVPWVEGLRFSVDYFNIEQSDIVAGPNAIQVRNNDAQLLRAATQAALAAGVPYENIDLGSGTAGYAGNPLIGRAAVTATDRAVFAAYNAGVAQSEWVAPVGILTSTRTEFSNLDAAEIEGYDFNISLNLSDNGWGKFGVSTDWAYVAKYDRVGGYLGDVATLVGVDGLPKLRGTLNFNWSVGDWAGGIGAYYVGSYADTAATITDSAYESLQDKSYVATIDGTHYWKVDSSLTFNAFVAKTFSSDSPWFDGVSARLGVRNLTNEEAPLNSSPGGYDPSVYNAIAAGRGWSLRVSKKF
jgi:outer membrane receptor protein involved in Fe transport